MKGRTYRYFEGSPLYPFGYGLSYAKFEYSDAAFEGDKLSVTVKNVSDVGADEVVQAYVKPVSSPYAVPNVSLCAFKRITLAPGESVRVSLPIADRAFEVVNDAGKWVSGGSDFILYVGGGQPDARTAELTGNSVVEVSVKR